MKQYRAKNQRKIFAYENLQAKWKIRKRVHNEWVWNFATFPIKFQKKNIFPFQKSLIKFEETFLNIKITPKYGSYEVFCAL